MNVVKCKDEKVCEALSEAAINQSVMHGQGTVVFKFSTEEVFALL